VARGPGRRAPTRRHVDTGPQYRFYTSCNKVIEPQPNGSLILRLHVNDLRLIKRWVMYWAAECEVVEPEESIAMVVSDLQAVGWTYRRGRTR
jgi:predicted DNA-binding transcriptional regulator YafY